MSEWSSADRQKLDSGRTLLVLRSASLNGGGWALPFVAEQKRRRRRRVLVGHLAELLFLVGLGVFLLMMAGCSCRYELVPIRIETSMGIETHRVLRRNCGWTDLRIEEWTP